MKRLIPFLAVLALSAAPAQANDLLDAIQQTASTITAIGKAVLGSVLDADRMGVISVRSRAGENLQVAAVQIPVGSLSYREHGKRHRTRFLVNLGIGTEGDLKGKGTAGVGLRIGHWRGMDLNAYGQVCTDRVATYGSLKLPGLGEVGATWALGLTLPL